ncbi:hypothetical protein PV379_13445 [Streptomyces caniscabiei]|uniref:hypothetical protein n=1 Tax=Streptomyces caniscabiei TaxID=2746961 RepID=UPI0029A97E47|nr:hypothetical protein [Streptomyces caniscabiei]MDX2603257.1 hypothetical protein [Streptomyces caniscabiei]MDX2740333.1 hypothetical protein [Streptomyces caniscabiei]MDX2778311.1 hypothetical protein [Streptomyces caniscabiei]
MSTSSRLRPAGVRASAAAVLAALTVTGASLITAPAAVAAPGDPDVVIHKVGFPFDNQRNQPLVCDFYLSAFNFPEDPTPSQRISWTIDRQPPAPRTDPVATGEITLAADGTGHSTPVAPPNAARLPDGNYVLTWRTIGGTLEEGRRDINVDCPLAGLAGPEGAVPAGGGGLALTQNFSPVAGAAAVGLAAAGGVAYLRLRRRRADGAA